MDSVAKLFKLSVTVEQQKRQQQLKQDEEEDSYIDFELISVSAGDIQTPQQRPQIPTKLIDHINPCSDSISKRKILPIEPNSKPQSPIQLPKSAPKFPVSIFTKQRSTPKNRAPAGAQEQSNRVLNSKLSRDNSTRRIGGVFPPDPCAAPATTAAPASRFSKEAMRKYLKLIKPKAAAVKRPSGGGDRSTAAVDSPVREKHENGLPAGIRLVCKHLGKSKSASAAAGLAVAPPVNRRDDSLMQQDDGIQSAILHCKRSFNASTGKSLFSMSEAATSQESSRTSSCKDFPFKEGKKEGI